MLFTGSIDILGGDSRLDAMQMNKEMVSAFFLYHSCSTLRFYSMPHHRQDLMGRTFAAMALSEF